MKNVRLLNSTALFYAFLFGIVDWMIANMLAIQQGSIGHIRYVLKDSLKYLPFYGAYFRQVGCHSLRRY